MDSRHTCAFSSALTTTAVLLRRCASFGLARLLSDGLVGLLASGHCIATALCISTLNDYLHDCPKREFLTGLGCNETIRRRIGCRGESCTR